MFINQAELYISFIKSINPKTKMGAFFLYRKEKDIDIMSIQEVYKKKGFNSPQIFDLGLFNLLLYKKQLIKTSNFFKFKEWHIFSTGSFVYKKLSFIKSLESFLYDFINNKVDKNQVIGNFVVIIKNENNNSINLLNDSAYVKNVYYDEKNEVISSDFLSVLNSTNEHYQLNKPAIQELLITGALIGPETIIKGINRIERNNLPNINNISFIDITPNIHITKNESFEEAVDQQLQALNYYFLSQKNLVNEYGANIGLTGGFDSRLLLTLGKRHFDKLHTNSFWRPNDLEFENAEKLAKTANLPFSYIKTPEIESDCHQLEKALDSTYYFFDGHIRAQSYWIEVFNSSGYAKELLVTYKIGYHGSGGEQYRNQERFIKKSINLTKWIYYDLIYKHCGNCFNSKEAKKKVVERIEKKIVEKLNLKNRRIELAEIKKYNNEVWNLSNRTVRLNMMNQLSFYFAPFTEYLISHYAYRAIPFLKNSLQFQMKMIKDQDSDLAKVVSNYGFNFFGKEPFINAISPLLLFVIPKPIVSKVLLNKRKSIKNFQVIDLINKCPELKKYINAVKKLNIEVKMDNIIKSKTQGKLLIDMGYFLEKNKNKIIL